MNQYQPNNRRIIYMNITMQTVQQKSLLLSDHDANILIKAFIPTESIRIIERLRDMCGSAIDYERMQSKRPENSKSFSPGYVPPTADKILADIIAEVELIGVAQRMKHAITQSIQSEIEKEGK